MPMYRVVAAAALMLSAACSGSSTGYGSSPPPAPPPPPPSGHSTTITVANNSFSPTPDTINAGTITFHWAQGSVTHNVIWDSGPAPLPTNSANKAAGDPDYTPLLGTGTYTYHCSFHGGIGSGMSGQIVVLP